MDVEDDLGNFLSIEVSAPSTSAFDNDEIHSSMEDNSQSMQMTLLDGTFFKYVPEKSTFTKKVGICVKCLPKTIEIKGHNKCSSNFVTHLKRKHGPEAVEAYRKHLQVGRKNKIKRTVSSPFTGIIKPRLQAIFQEQFDTNVVNYFIHSMIPLRTVEDPFFVRLINNLNISDYELQMPSERSLRRKIIDQHFQQMSEIKEKLVPVKYVCTTVDIWSRQKISFLGVTVHWIDENLERQSAAVACRRFKGAYTYDQITKQLNEIHSNFGLDLSKVVATIIDNGSNFINMFRIFGFKTKSLLATEHIDESITFSDNESETVSILEDPFKGEPLGIKAEPLDITHIKTDPLDIINIKVEPLDITHIKAEPLDIIQDDSMDNSIILPDNLRCCAHILNLSASSDVESLLSDNKTALGNMHEEVMDKCSILWNAAGQSKSVEIIQSVLGHTLTRPEATRWNSLYDSLKQIANTKNKILLLSRELEIKNPLNDIELDYIEEYVQCTAPIADALDILQGDDTFYGVVLPCLLALRKKLRKLNKQELKYCKLLIKEYLKSVERRFHDFYSISSEQAVNSIVAALSYPRFKNKWFNCIEPIHHAKLMNLFETEICKEINLNMEEMKTESQPRASCKTKEDAFFDFNLDSRSESESMNCSKTMAEMIMLSFFAEESRNVNILQRYPFIQKVFIKYNTPMPSSEPVGKMFSFTTMINLLKCHNSSDEMFENLVVMKRNLNFFNK